MVGAILGGIIGAVVGQQFCSTRAHEAPQVEANQQAPAPLSSPTISIEGAAAAAVSFSSWQFSLNGGSLRAVGRMTYRGAPVQGLSSSCVLDGAKQDGIVIVPTLQAGETGIVEVNCMMSNPDKIVLTID